MAKYLLKNMLIVRSDRVGEGELSIVGQRIEQINFYDNGASLLDESLDESYIRLDLSGKYLFAGAIDAHVHFREPGMSHKASILTESKAALLGGVTSFIDMPNTVPPTTSLDRVEEKKELAAKSSYINYGFNIGATNENIATLEEIVKTDKRGSFAAIKVFMGSSTGNMLVDDNSAINRLFRIRNKPVFIHSEDEQLIKENMKKAIAVYGDNIPFSEHSLIRSSRACILSTIRAIEAAIKYQTCLHVLHISTAQEIEMIAVAKKYNPNITAETSANYLYFTDMEYESRGAYIKCNPAIKSQEDRAALLEALEKGLIDTIGSDHAPHLKEEKEGSYLQAPSGLPSIAQSFPAMLRLFMDKGLKLSYLSSIMSENIAGILGIGQRGVLKEGYYADIVVFDPKTYREANNSDYFCGWNPYNTEKFPSLSYAFVNGTMLVEDNSLVSQEMVAMPLDFEK